MNHEKSVIKRRRWTRAEDEHLRRHREEGADAIGAALSRTPAAVANRASRLGVSLASRPWSDGDECPRCGVGRLVRGGPGWAQGVCPACRSRMLAAAAQARADELAARRAYDRARQRLSSERRAADEGG